MSPQFIEEKEDPRGEASPTLAKVIEEATRSAALDLRVALPAEVVRYNKDRQLVDVQPQIKRRYPDKTVRDMPIIYNVPVAFPRAGNAYISMPIKKGHNLLLVFVDRSLDKWLSTGGRVDPEDTRAHHLSDAIAYPGLYPFSNPVPIDNDDDIIIRNAKAGASTEIRIKPNGHLQAINRTAELVRTLYRFVRAIREAITYTGIGPQRLHHVNFQAIENELGSFLER